MKTQWDPTPEKSLFEGRPLHRLSLRTLKDIARTYDIDPGMCTKADAIKLVEGGQRMGQIPTDNALLAEDVGAWHLQRVNGQPTKDSEPDYVHMNQPQLRSIARGKGKSFPKDAKKAEIVNWLNGNGPDAP